jgi:hypothetical protein
MQGLITDAGDVDVNDFVLSKQMADTLHKAYPGHLWAVAVQGKQGIAKVYNLALSGQWGFLLKLKDHSTASDWDKQVVRAGGELLERYRVARGRANPEALNHLSTDFAGRHRPDL